MPYTPASKDGHTGISTTVEIEIEDLGDDGFVEATLKVHGLEGVATLDFSASPSDPLALDEALAYLDILSDTIAEFVSNAKETLLLRSTT